MHDLAGAVVAQLRILEANPVARAAEAPAAGAAPAGESAALIMGVAAEGAITATRDLFPPFRPTAFGVQLQHGMRGFRFLRVEGLARQARKNAA